MPLHAATLVVDPPFDSFGHSRLAAQRWHLVAAINRVVVDSGLHGVPVVRARTEFAADRHDALLKVCNERITHVCARSTAVDACQRENKIILATGCSGISRCREPRNLVAPQGRQTWQGSECRRNFRIPGAALKSRPTRALACNSADLSPVLPDCCGGFRSRSRRRDRSPARSRSAPRLPRAAGTAARSKSRRR